MCSKIEGRLPTLIFVTSSIYGILRSHVDGIQEEMRAGFAELRQEMDKRFEKIDERFEKIDERFEKMEWNTGYR